VKKALFFASAILCLVAAAAFSDSVAAETGDEVVLEYDPRSIHQQMWEDLRPRLAERARAESTWMLKTASNWQEYDMDYYHIELDIDHVAEVLYGRVGTYGTVGVTTLDSVKINLLDAMTVDSVYNETGNLVFNHAEHHLTVFLDKAYAADEQFYFTVVYHGTPASSEGFLGMDFTSRSGLPLITTLSEPMGARSWWPCNDIPRDKVDSADIIVTVDTSLVVSSNGLVESDVDNGDGTHTVHWKSRYPIAPYLVSLGIHPYAVWYDWYPYSPTDSMPLHFYVYPDHDQNSRQYFDSIVVRMIQELSVPFGQYPFIEEKYGCTHFNWGGAMEHQTNTSTTSSSFGYSQPVICHELGHQWWGDMVTCSDWHHIWINEGFAVYSEALYFEAINGASYYHSYMNSFEYGGGGSIYIEDTTSIWNIFGAIVYDKGGWVLHMLRHVVGDSLFFESLADYRQQYMWSHASTEDFQGVVETTSGMDLDWFFQQWIYGTYRPNYRYSYLIEADAGGGWNMNLHVRQIQATDPQVFTMPIDIQITTSGAAETQVVFNDSREQNFVLHTDDEPLYAYFDSKRWISRYVESETYTMHIVNDNLADAVQTETYEDTVLVKTATPDYLCEIISGSLPSGLTLELTTGVISGAAFNAGDFAFTVRATHQQYGYVDSMAYTLHVASIPDRPGDADIDGEISVADAVFIINYIFKGGPEPGMLNWADVNADCVINVGDPFHLINFIFKGGPGPQLGCVE